MRKFRPKSKRNSITKKEVPLNPWLPGRHENLSFVSTLQMSESIDRQDQDWVWRCPQSTHPGLPLRHYEQNAQTYRRTICLFLLTTVYWRRSLSTQSQVYTVHKSTQFAFTRVNQSEVVAENGRSWATMRWNGSTSLQEREGSILNFRCRIQARQYNTFPMVKEYPSLGLLRQTFGNAWSWCCSSSLGLRS